MSDKLIDNARKAAAYLEHAACHLDRFEDAFTGVSDILGGRTFHMVRVHTDGRQDFVGAPESVPIVTAYLNGGWDKVDSWSRAAQVATRSGRIVTDGMIIPDELRSRDIFFQDFCSDWDMGHYASWTFNLSGQLWGYTLSRNYDNPVSDDEIKSLGLIQPVANRAAILATLFRDHRIRGLADGLERSGRPSIVLGEDGSVVFFTSSVRKYLGGAFDIRKSRLASNDDANASQIRLLERWLRDRSTLAAPMLSFRNPETAGQIIGLPLLAPDAGSTQLPGARLILMLVDLDQPREPGEKILVEAFRLTPRETSVARLLAAGHDVADIAAQLALQPSSIRQVIKLILAKTGQSRQASLVGLLARLYE